MLIVVKPRVLACALVFMLCAGAPQLINADEAGELAAVITPATNRTSAKAVEPSDSSLARALAEIHGTSRQLNSLNKAVRNERTSWPTPARFFTINQVLAKRENGPSSLELASIRPAETLSDLPAAQIAPTQGDEPFGLYTFKAPGGLLSVKWHKLEADVAAETPDFERCRRDAESCTPAAARFAAIIKDASSLSGRARLQLVNDRVNSAIRYTEDSAQWHDADVWSAPLDITRTGSFDTGRGDCEDYAIAKYLALRQAGVSERDLRVLLVRDQAVRLDHAVLAVRNDGHWLILDNRWSRLSDDNELRQFLPLFALNHDGVKLFAAPYANRSVTPEKTPHLAEQDSYTDAGVSYSARVNLELSGALPLLM